MKEQEISWVECQPERSGAREALKCTDRSGLLEASGLGFLDEKTMKPQDTIKDLLNKCHLSDCIDFMRGLPDNCVTGVITDPPAGIAFMGKAWDNLSKYGARTEAGQRVADCFAPVWKDRALLGFLIFTVDYATEALRVTIPGGHAIVWSLPRVQDITQMGLRLAGWEIRDQISHLFGSGFCKSHNMSKAIDKMNGDEREVIGEVGKLQSYGYEGNNTYGGDIDRCGKMDITAPASEQSAKWEGFGTALAPSYEGYIVAKKPEISIEFLQEIEYIILYINELIVRLCHIHNAKFAEKISMPDPEGLGVETSVFAQWIAESQRILDGITTQADMFISTSDRISGFVNTVTSWRNTLVDLLTQWKMFTISTELKTTTELKTLKSLLGQNMHEGIIRDVMKASGLSVLVEIVESLLNVEKLRLQTTQTTFAAANALKKVHGLLSKENQLHQEGKETNSDTSSENWILAMKPIPTTFAQNAINNGVAGLNIDAGRVGSEGGTRKGEAPTTASVNSYGDGLNGGGCIPLNKGRWPSNTILSEEAAKELDLKHGIKTSGTHNGYGHKTGSVYGKFEKTNPAPEANSGGVSRYFYVAKPTSGEKDAGLQDFFWKKDGKEWVRISKESCSELKGSKDGSKVQLTTGNIHPTVKAISLIEQFVNLLTMPEGTVILDMFSGSGTISATCGKLGVDWISCDMDQRYVEISNARAKYWTAVGKEGREAATPEEVKVRGGQFSIFDAGA